MNRYNLNISSQEITKWFKGQGFHLVQFTNGKTYVSGYWQGAATSVKLKEKVGYDTYYKIAYGGAILVFYVTVHDGVLLYEAYVPMWLFGFWNLKISFKQNSSSIFKYRSEGFEVEERFKKWLKLK